MAFPTETTTGVPDGTKLTRFTGTYYVTRDNAVIDGMEIIGNVIIEADNVTIKNSKIVSTTPWHLIRVMDGVTGFTLMDSELDGGGDTVNGVLGPGTFLRNDIHNVHNGLNIWGPSLVESNYIHDLQGDAEAHYDGIEINGGSDITIRNNTIINDHNQTSAIMMANEFGSISDIIIDGNRLFGGGYTIYVEDRKAGGPVDDASIQITNNEIGGGYYGDFALYGNKPVMHGNVDIGELPEAPQTLEIYGADGNDLLPSQGHDNSGNESYFGLDGNDVIQGGDGADAIDGGNGIDTASYVGSTTGVSINLSTGTASGGEADGDTLVGIENLTGSRYADRLVGDNGANVLRDSGGPGADTLSGLGGNDTYQVYNSGTTIVEAEGQGVDRVMAGVDYALGVGDSIEILATNGTAGKSSIDLTGNEFGQTIWGNSGANRIDGKGGEDVLRGFGGADTFVFSAALGVGNVDEIVDLKPGVDKIELDSKVFTGIDPGTLPASALWSNTTGAAHDANDRIIYETDTGRLFYDADGTGGAAPVQFATLTGIPEITNADFRIV